MVLKLVKSLVIVLCSLILGAFAEDTPSKSAQIEFIDKELATLDDLIGQVESKIDLLQKFRDLKIELGPAQAQYDDRFFEQLFNKMQEFDRLKSVSTTDDPILKKTHRRAVLTNEAPIVDADLFAVKPMTKSPEAHQNLRIVTVNQNSTLSIHQSQGKALSVSLPASLKDINRVRASQFVEDLFIAVFNSNQLQILSKDKKEMDFSAGPEITLYGNDYFKVKVPPASKDEKPTFDQRDIPENNVTTDVMLLVTQGKRLILLGDSNGWIHIVNGEYRVLTNFKTEVSSVQQMFRLGYMVGYFGNSMIGFFRPSGERMPVFCEFDATIISVTPDSLKPSTMYVLNEYGEIIVTRVILEKGNERCEEVERRKEVRNTRNEGDSYDGFKVESNRGLLFVRDNSEQQVDILSVNLDTEEQQSTPTKTFSRQDLYVEGSLIGVPTTQGQSLPPTILKAHRPIGNSFILTQASGSQSTLVLIETFFVFPPGPYDWIFSKVPLVAIGIMIVVCYKLYTNKMKELKEKREQKSKKDNADKMDTRASLNARGGNRSGMVDTSGGFQGLGGEDSDEDYRVQKGMTPGSRRGFSQRAPGRF